MSLDDIFALILPGIKMAATFGRKIGTVMAFESDFETDNISAQI